MKKGYEIRSHQYMGTTLYVLAKEGSDDFIERMYTKRNDRKRLKLILETIDKIFERGISNCIGKRNFIRILDSKLCMAEVKVGGKTIRVMSYCTTEPDEALVLLFDFDGHAGKNGKIPGNIMKKGKRLAGIAGKCMEEEIDEG